MAFTREFIRRLAKESDVELPKEFIDSIISEHTTSRDAYSEEQVKQALENNKPSNVKVEDTDEYKALKQRFDDFKAETSAKETRQAKERAVREFYKAVGISEKRIDTVLKVTNLDDFEIDADGKLVDTDKHEKTVKSEWSDFIETTTTHGAQTANPPANHGGAGSVKTKEEIYKIENGRYVLSASERQAELAKLYQSEKGE